MAGTTKKTTGCGSAKSPAPNKAIVTFVPAVEYIAAPINKITSEPKNNLRRLKYFVKTGNKPTANNPITTLIIPRNENDVESPKTYIK